ncbi:ATP synthase mitochondrial F1 complex assembly factor 2 [Condylostylus longicornis]|uniref:ATP synthase mitochondrial F1 complex assembly factor 2 n=1 Tax=Condylostylus longicornis TaxID=2530218 RepID=UPI00244E1F71|nr:ATP synthase mitochondrial F1 complex assembly factor 2 [Condylostylus longicornis]
MYICMFITKKNKHFIFIAYYKDLTEMNAIIPVLKNSVRNVVRQQLNFRSFATKKRFFKNTSVLYSDGKYEITLDHRKLKTPTGAPFSLKSEPLAIAVANEWDSQKNEIKQSSMHLTGLCFTCLDNPNKLQKSDMVNYCLNFLSSDTVLFQSEDEKDLKKLQKKEWDPIIEWFNKRYDTDLQKTTDFSSPKMSADDKMKISKYLNSYNDEILHGITFAIDTLKSIILAFAVIDQYLDVERAVHLARLEEEYQLKFWGRVEWSHDLSQQDLQARLAASILFIHLNRSENFIRQKSIT